MQKTWVFTPLLKKLDKAEKNLIIAEVQKLIPKFSKLNIVNRIDIKGGRIYFYKLVEQFGWDDPNSQWIKPLIDGKYCEFIYARININKDNTYTVCGQRYNDQWIEFETFNSLEESLNFIENECWFINY